MNRVAALTLTGMLALGLGGCQAKVPSEPIQDHRGGWTEGTARYCVEGQGQKAQLLSRAGWLDHYAHEDYLLLGGHDSMVGKWVQGDVTHTWSIGELQGFVDDHELLMSVEKAPSGPITCVAPRYP